VKGYQQFNSSVILLAPTGKAARRMSEVIGLKASTIHSKLQLFDSSSVSEVEIKDSLIIIDEFSIVDAFLAKELFTSIKKGCTVVISGDVDQLPSVGAGSVLKELISSDKIPTYKLEKVYRQKDGSSIISNAHNIKEGKPLVEADNFNIYECFDSREIEDDIYEAYKKAAQTMPLEDIMCLSPYKEHDAGVYNLNLRLEQCINPNGEKLSFPGNFKNGDYVINLKNREDCANGETGYVIGVYVEKNEEKLHVDFDGKAVYYSKDELNELDLAYCTTIHKSQGSEAKTVIINASKNTPRPLLTKNIFYTAITRAKEKVIIYGNNEAIEYAINNNVEQNRISLLSDFMK